MAPALHWIVLLPLAAAAVAPGVARRFPRQVGWLLLLVPAAITVYLLGLAPRVAGGDPVVSVWRWAPNFGLEFSLWLDGFGLLFALLIAGIGTLVVAYANAYLGAREDRGRFYLCLFLFMGAMLGVVLAENALVLYMFWELTSVSSFLLIGFWHTRGESRDGALKAMLITVLGGLSLLFGLLLMGASAGTLSIRELMAFGPGVRAHKDYPLIAGLILLGAFTKSAQAPFHIWLPAAMAAPTPVSAYLHSATMVKAGIFLTARMGAILGGTDLWFYAVAAAGLATMVLGGFLAVQQRDLKALLAYSTVSQLGFIITMFGLGTDAALAAGILHILNHAVFKGSLFMAVGIIDHETGTRDVPRLSGLARAMPVTAVVMFLGALAMAGVPLLNGFVSKEMIFEALLHPPRESGWLAAMLPLLAVVGSVFTTTYCLLITLKVFLGPQGANTPKPPHEAPGPLLAPPLVLAALVVLLGVAPELVAGPLVAGAVQALGGASGLHLGVWHGITPALGMSIAALALGAILYWRLPYALPVLRRVSGVRWNANAFYQRALQLLEEDSQWWTRRVMTGNIRDYFVYVIGFAVVLTGFTLIRTGLPGLRTALSSLTPIGWLELVTCLILMGGAGLAAGAALRISLALGAASVGFAVAVLWFLWNAPDLALTQTIVETVSIIPLFLAFGFMPALRHRWTAPRVRPSNVAVAVAAGVVSAAYTLLTQGNRLFDTIGHFYVENSLPIGGGRNVVNVMLVDFRGFDTIFETTVFGLSAVAVFTLVASRLERGGAVRPRSPLMLNPVIVPSVSRVLYYLVLVFALYLFFRGHHNPGGGFAAGVMAASAVVIWALAYERTAALAMVPVHPRNLIATGLCTIGAVGLGSVLAGYPFLTRGFLHLHLPWVGEVELASAMLFDLGVAFTVAGTIIWLVAAMSDGVPLEQEHVQALLRPGTGFPERG